MRDRFELKSKLGSGGFGTVWEAYDRERGERVAVKMLAHMAADALYRFKQEFRDAQGLHHPNLVRLGELHELGGSWLFSMEIVDGVDFLEHCRPGDVPDFGVIRSACVQLVRGLVAVHGAGLVHRDIKPSNVRVTPAGRVVILDFGMASHWGGAGLKTTHVPGGTALYMAPEQAGAAAPSPAADYYALGVMLYEVLTGRLPFEGPAIRVLLDKQTQTPRSPREIAPDVPEDLDLLAMQLLLPNPDARPTPEQVLSALGDQAAASTLLSTSLTVQSHTETRRFVGRNTEVALLTDSFRVARERGPRAVLVEGEAGIGKSALIAHFCAELRALSAECVVLEGRCHVHENVAYRGFDGLVDALARHLKRLDPAVCDQLMPRDAGLLPRLFPVLGRVPSIVRTPSRHAATEAPLVKRRAFDALAELLSRLSEKRPLVLVIDDLHFSDAESVLQWAELLGAREPPRVLFVGTLRTDADVGAELREALATLWERSRALRISLDALPEADAVELAEEAIGGDGSAELAAAIARESGGQPSMILALVEQARESRGQLEVGVDLERALRRVIERLDGSARRVLEAVALSSVALELRALAHVTGMATHDVSSAVAELRARKLVRSGRGSTIECFHPDVRVALDATLLPGERTQLHRRIAQVLERQISCDAAALAGHWLLAGEPGRAVPSLMRAADHAMASFSFERAVHLHRLLMAHAKHLPDEELAALRIRQAHALAGSGKLRDAAREYAACAERAPADQALELRLSAMHNLLRSGQVEAGLALAAELLAGIGVSVERAPSRAAFALRLERLRLYVRGLSFAVRAEDQLSSEARHELEVLSAIARAWSRVDLAPALLVRSTFLRRALERGTAVHVACALAAEAEALAGAESFPQRRTFAVLQAAERAATSEGGFDRACVTLARGTVHALRFELPQARAALEQAELELGRHLASHWERVSAQALLLRTWLLQGELARVCREGERWIGEARSGGDLMAEAHLVLSGSAYVRHLVRDEPDAALTEIRKVAGVLTGGLLLEEACLSAQQAVLRMREPSTAGTLMVRALEERWGAFARDGRLRRPVSALRLWELRARAYLDLAAFASGAERTRALHEVARAARQVLALRWSTSQVVAADLEAHAQLLEGASAGALARARDALEGYERLGMLHEAHALRFSLGRALATEEGTSLVRSAVTWASSQGVRAPVRFLAARRLPTEAER